MKVAFWNGISNVDSVTNYVAAIGMLLALECNCNVVLSGNYISNRMLQDCFSRRMMEEGIAHTPYCFLYGSSEYRDVLWQMKRNRQGNILEMPLKKMKIIYPPDDTVKSLFYYRIRQQDFYLLDLAKCTIAESRDVLDEADLVVVFLSQDKMEIQNFFERFSSLVPKALIVIVKYRRDIGHLLRNLKEEYGISSEKMVAVPKNRNFSVACEEGDLCRFMTDSKYRSDTKQDSFFISAVKKIANKIRALEICLCAEDEEYEQKL